MASVGSVTRQIAALEISAKQNGATKPSRPLQKTSSQTSVSKLLTKFAAPLPFPDAKPKSTAKAIPTRSANPPQSTVKPSAPASQKAAAAPTRTPSLPKPPSNGDLDIGKYDGGFEIENEKRGETVDGEAARELALDSSVSRFVFLSSFSSPIFTVPTKEPAPRESGIYPTLILAAL
jgi:hypothetical protein